jgi:3-oxoacyl-[acyl-carrier protein] reductase
VVVTGGSRGIGRAMALGLLRAGARVSIVSQGPSAVLDRTLAEAREIAPAERAQAIFGDLRDPEACERIAAEARPRFGSIHTLVNNAGIPAKVAAPSFWELSIEEWDRQMRTNCDAVFYMTRAVVPDMIAQGFGKIISISTSDATMVRPRYTPYGPGKAFIDACSRAWAAELAGTGVTVNVLHPGGAVDTAREITGVPTYQKPVLPADVVVPPLLWLVSDESDGHSRERYAARLWDETLDLEARLAAARQSGAPTVRIM